MKIQQRWYCHWKHIVKVLAFIFVLCWALWTYQRYVIHTAKFMWSAQYRECVHRRRNYEIEEQTSAQYVTLVYHGRLGNWMYSYASLLGIAKANGYVPYLISSHPLHSYFDLSKGKENHADCLYTVTDDLGCTYNPELLNLPPGNISIDGYLQSWKYFRFFSDQIRKEFKMHQHLRASAERDFKHYVGEYLQEGRLVISIHVRRGDVLKPEARKLGFCHAPKEYFDNAMKHMLARFPFSVFFVTSDDIGWCRQNLIPPRLHQVPGHKKHKGANKKLTDKVPIVFSSSHTSWQDFALLTMCNHSIVSVGTFGWWGAWLANGHVTYYSGFPLPGTKVDHETNKEDFFPTNWVAISRGTSGMKVFHNGRSYACLIVSSLLVSVLFKLSFSTS